MGSGFGLQAATCCFPRPGGFMRGGPEAPGGSPGPSRWQSPGRTPHAPESWGPEGRGPGRTRALHPTAVEPLLENKACAGPGHSGRPSSHVACKRTGGEGRWRRLQRPGRAELGVGPPPYARGWVCRQGGALRDPFPGWGQGRSKVKVETLALGNLVSQGHRHLSCPLWLRNRGDIWAGFDSKR